MINYYEPENCEAFDEIIKDFPDVRFFQPSPDKAPWHVQATFDVGSGIIILNFWPHRSKGQRQPLAAVEGSDAVRALIVEAVADWNEYEADHTAFDVIEG